jgi:dihydrofolate reductase
MKPQVSLIVAVAKNGVIGCNNTLPWHLPEDLKHFRALTTGHHIIMGRKTYESLGRLLPGRTTVIVTRNADYQLEGALIAHSLEEAIDLSSSDTEAFVIGGAELYKQALACVDKLYVTEVDLTPAGDAYFPPVDAAQWQMSAREAHISAQGLAFDYVCYQRRAAAN